MRLARRVAEHGLPRCERSRHDGVLGRHDAGFVEEDLRAAQPIGVHLVAAVDLDLRAKLRERVDVRVKATAADDVTARRRNGDASKS